MWTAVGAPDLEAADADRPTTESLESCAQRVAEWATEMISTGAVKRRPEVKEKL